MRSFILQLVLFVSASEEAHGTEPGRFDLPFLGDDAYLSSAVTRYEMGRLREAYVRMARQLSSHPTVVCLVHGVDDFETAENNWRAEMWLGGAAVARAGAFPRGAAGFQTLPDDVPRDPTRPRGLGYEECISPTRSLWSSGCDRRRLRG